MPRRTIDLSHTGVVQDEWHDIARVLPRFSDALRRRLVVVAPHPDDETLGVGGLIADTSRRGGRVLVVSMTDGEAASDEPGLGARRHAELKAALARLRLAAPVECERWQMPDGHLAALEAVIRERLVDLVRPGDLVVGPLDCDGHPDHDAAGAAVLSLSGDPTIEVASYPVWAWHWHEPLTSVINDFGQRVDLRESALAAKMAALTMFTSQTSGRDPVLPDHFISRFVQPFEVLVPA